PEEKDRSDTGERSGRTVRAEQPQRHGHGPAEAKEQPKQKEPAVRKTLREHPYLIAASIILLILAVIGTILWWMHARHFESTDDAFIDTRVVVVSAQIGGAIVDVPVTDNQLVDAGAVLLRLDDRDYRAALAQAHAQIDQAQAAITNLAAQIDAQQARIDHAEKQVSE